MMSGGDPGILFFLLIVAPIGEVTQLVHQSREALLTLVTATLQVLEDAVDQLAPRLQ